MILPLPKCETYGPIQIHVDSSVALSRNWFSLQGWVTGLSRGILTATTTQGTAHCLLVERPDVCLALKLEPAFAYGFTLNILSPEALPDGSIEVVLQREGAAFAKLYLSVPRSAPLPLLPFATAAAVKLTRKLFQQPDTGLSADQCDDIIILENGAIAPQHLSYDFDNTRIGNYHPDIFADLSRPGAIGLDIGCGLRDRVFDNLVTQDIYPSPTATLVTRPETLQLPFARNSFDLIVMDSVLEHVPDPVAMLVEGRRLLKPGGCIYGDVPFLQPLHLEPHHYFNFTPYGLATVADKAGLHLEYAKAENHQRPEFSLEWLLRRTFETVSDDEANRLRKMRVGELFDVLTEDKNCIDYSAPALRELAAGYRFHLRK